MRKFFITMLIAASSILSAAASVHSISNYNISNDGEEFIKQYEKCSLVAYWDSNGYSIGYGHHAADIKEGQRITQKKADEYFHKDIMRTVAAVNRLLRELPYDYEFSQGFIDGMCSLVYNCGENGVRQSTFYKRLLACRVKNGIMDESDYNYTVAGVKVSRISCEAHKRRRHAEHLLMASL